MHVPPAVNDKTRLNRALTGILPKLGVDFCSGLGERVGIVLNRIVSPYVKAVWVSTVWVSKLPPPADTPQPRTK